MGHGLAWLAGVAVAQDELSPTFLPPLQPDRCPMSVTCVVGLIHQYLEMPLSHMAQIAALFLRTAVSRSPFHVPLS